MGIQDEDDGDGHKPNDEQQQAQQQPGMVTEKFTDAEPHRTILHDAEELNEKKLHRTETVISRVFRDASRADIRATLHTVDR